MRVALCSIVVLCLLSQLVQADDDRAAAREAYREGTRFYDLNQYPQALDAFRRAYLKFEEPTLLFNIAQCQRALGEKEEAVKSYRSYLRKLPGAPNRADVERIIEGLEEVIQKEKAAQQIPPNETLRGEARTVNSSPAPMTSTKDRPVKTPLHKKWWLWTAVGGAVVVVGAIALGVTLSGSSDGPYRFGTVEGN